ncbi:hypothetical protein [Halioxenophilus aromaticivorans]|uniref:Uncharacterized protein n=1 Tax=Halioxenophilus aromaticivorans TaxID=1306992 RepID=A0AAV3U296_9ALTE
MKAKDFDQKFDASDEDILNELDFSSAKRVNQQQKRIKIDFPV